jgi:glycosyltransferase involved in cell wall biosynthesis
MTSRAPSIQSSKKRIANKPPSRARTTVLHLCPDLEPGDPARETVDLAILTQRAGWRALIASSGGLLVNDAERAAVRHIPIALNRSDMLARWRNRMRLAALIQKERPVLLHAHGLEAATHGLSVARSCHLPLIVDFTRPLPEQRHVRRLLKRLSRLPCAARVPSRYMARQLREVFHWPAERLHAIPPGIDLQTYNAGFISPERVQALVRLWRLPEQAAVIVMPMPFNAGSGHKLLLEALARIKHDDVFVVLVGDNRPMAGWHEEIEALVNGFGLSGKVIMPDYCLDWPAACWLASVIIAPNDVARGQANELLAAQAIGRPVIASNCGANSQMVQSGETAWLVPPGNVQALAEALAEAISLGTDQRLDLAQRTRDFVAGAFPQATWFDAMIGLYESMLAPADRRKAAAA